MKIPKIILYRGERERVMPLSDADRKLARDEYDSLTFLWRHWPTDDLNVRFVKPLGFLPDYNAIVTERFYADHFFKVLRRSDLRLSGERPDVASRVMSRLGMALAGFHRSSLKACRFQAGPVTAKMTECCVQLKAFGAASSFVDGTVLKLQGLDGLDVATAHANTLKGFDVRQVFVSNDDAVYLLDPGRIKPDYKEADLARFIVTCRILYWGSTLFFLRMTPNPWYERSFRRGYYGDGEEPLGRVLSLLIIKELLKHWRMAYLVMAAKGWPAVARRLVGKTYVDPFYKAEITREFGALGS